MKASLAFDYQINRFYFSVHKDSCEHLSALLTGLNCDHDFDDSFDDFFDEGIEHCYLFSFDRHAYTMIVEEFGDPCGIDYYPDEEEAFIEPDYCQEEYEDTSFRVVVLYGLSADCPEDYPEEDLYEYCMLMNMSGFEEYPDALAWAEQNAQDYGLIYSIQTFIPGLDPYTIESNDARVLCDIRESWSLDGPNPVEQALILAQTDMSTECEESESPKMRIIQSVEA